MELQEPSRPQRVCVLGAGVSGVSVCLALEEKGFAVDLIGRYESFYYKVAGNKAAVIPGFEKEAICSYAGLLQNSGSRFVWGEAVAIDSVKKKIVVQLCGEKPERREFAYDYLVCATGNSGTNHIELPDKALSTEEMVAAFKEMQERFRQDESFTIVGGGQAGCELSGELKAEYPEKEVHLLHSRDHLLSSSDIGWSSLQKEDLKERLKGLGVDVNMNLGHDYTIEGLGIKDSVVVHTVGSFPTGSFSRLYPEGWVKGDEVLVNEYFQVIGALASGKEGVVFSIGDVSRTSAKKSARAAFKHSLTVAENISRHARDGSESVLLKYVDGVKGEENVYGFGKVVKYLRSLFGTNTSGSASAKEEEDLKREDNTVGKLQRIFTKQVEIEWGADYDKGTRELCTIISGDS